MSKVINTGAKEEAKGKEFKEDKSVEGVGWGGQVGSNKHRTFAQGTTVCSHCETKSQH